jgi:undecaprenyl-diphosphatase
MAEALAIVGLVIPGVAIMFGIGALIATGAIDFWMAFGCAVAGAIVGDGLSFWLGRKLQGRAASTWPFSRYPETMERGVEFFQKYGGKSVAIGRFFGPVRAIIPLVAGMLGMQSWRYIIANVLSALLWAPTYLLPGILFGTSLELASQVALRLVGVILLLLFLVWALLRLTRLLFRLMQPHASSWVQALLNWSQLHPAFTQTAAALADPNHPEARGLALLTTLLLLATGLFALTLGATLQGTALGGLDHMVLQTMQSLRTPWSDHLMLYLSRLADIEVVLVLVAGVLLFLLWQRHWRPAIYWLAAAGFGLFASVALKHGLQIPRPPLGIDGLGPYSFPSSHVLRATVIFGFLAVIVARAMPLNWRWLPYAWAGLLTLLVTLARIYLGAHWLTDVIGSITLGMVWVSLLGIAYYRHTGEERHWLGLSLLALLLITSVATAVSLQRQQQDLARYTPQLPQLEMESSEWWRQGWSTLATMREDTRSQRVHPLNIQYAGPLKELASQLEQRGWSTATTLQGSNMLKLLSPDLELAQLPLPPQVHAGRHDYFTMSKELDVTQLLVIRLWPADITLLPEQQPLWIGNISTIHKETPLDLFALPKTGRDFAQPFDLLIQENLELKQQQPTEERDLLLLQIPDKR